MELLVAIIVLSLIFDYINGFHDAANSIATIVSTKVLTPFQAVLWAAFFNFVAFFIALYLSTRGQKSGTAPSLHIVWEKFPKFIIGFVAASLVFSICQMNGAFTPDAKGKLIEPGVAKAFSSLFFSLAFVCVGLETRLKDIISRENRALLWSFLTAQAFNIVITFIIACVLFGIVRPLWG